MTSQRGARPGPLAGIRVLELGGIGPGPFAGMMLADLGADVVRIERPDGDRGLVGEWHQVLLRGRRSVALDLKAPEAAEVVGLLAESTDIVVEGFRPGVVERLGVGPEDLLARNPALVYARMTGWGQSGALATTAGHDINYIAAAGALEPLLGPDGLPSPPLNMLGDFGGGGMLLAVGVLAALLQSRATGRGSVVDASIVDGTALLTAMLHSMRAGGHWSAEQGTNVFDGGAPFYRTYAASDGEWLAVGALEPEFYRALLAGLGLAGELAGVAQYDRSTWPTTRSLFAGRFAQRTRDEWKAVFDGTDACVTPVVHIDDVVDSDGGRWSRSFAMRGDRIEPLPAPRFDGREPTLPPPTPVVGEHTVEVLRAAGVPDATIARLRRTSAAVAAAP